MIEVFDAVTESLLWLENRSTIDEMGFWSC